MAPSGSHGRRRVSAGVLQTLTPGWTRPGGAAAIFARGRLSQAEITEHYFVDQEISKNPWTKQGRDPAGRIELALPYDGYEHFSRVARDDVARQIGTDVPSGETAIVGHLLLQDYHATNLGERLQLADRHGSIPIEVPVAPSVADHLEQLSADRQTCVARHTFEPESPAVLPAQMDIDLSDPDSLDLVSLDMAHLDPLTLDLHTEYAQQQLRAVMARITQQVSFRGELVLGISIRISVPAWPGLGQLRPKVARVAIDWPTITSLRTLSLRVGDGLPRAGRTIQFDEVPVRYNPVRRSVGRSGVPSRGSIEWEDVPMFAVDADERPDEETGESNDSKTRHYQSAPMLLSIEHPGELYKQDVLSAVAEVRIPRYLMSGMTARVYDATGYFLEEPLKLSSTVTINAELTLDDAFANRDFSPSHHLYFDEIIPDEMRITDIRTALQDRGFEARQVWPGHDGPFRDERTNSVSWLYVAHRKVGPDDMVLWVFAAGQHFETERETVMQGGGVTHKTKMQSGELRIFVRGSLRRDSRELTHEMNALQRTLRERYDRVRQRR